jgi:hypothetical protein
MAKAAKAKSPCEQGDGELLPWTIKVESGSRIDFSAWVCFANARVRVWVEPDPLGPPTQLVDETGKSFVTAILPALAPGRYQLYWSILTPAEKWQTRVEIAVKSTVRFRRKKSAEGGNPVQMGAVGLEVLPS